MFKSIKKWRKEWQKARAFFSMSDDARNKYTANFNKKWKPICEKAEKMRFSDDYETHLKGQKLCYDVWEAEMKYDRMICRVIMMEMFDDFARYLKEEWQK